MNEKPTIAGPPTKAGVWDIQLKGYKYALVSKFTDEDLPYTGKAILCHREHTPLVVPEPKKTFDTDDECPTCSVGFILPSGVCDHCNQKPANAAMHKPDQPTGPSREWLEKMAAAEDRVGSTSVGGLWYGPETTPEPPKPEPELKRGTSVGSYRGRPIPRWIESRNGGIAAFHRIAEEDEDGGVDLEQLAENEVVIAPGLIYQELLPYKQQTPDGAGFRMCQFCGCNTNAHARACCEQGREEDSKVPEPPKPKCHDLGPVPKVERVILASGEEYRYGFTSPQGVWLFKSDHPFRLDAFWQVLSESEAIAAGCDPAQVKAWCGEGEQGQEQELQRLRSRLQWIDENAKADAADLEKMRDGTKFTRAGIVEIVAYQQQEMKEVKARAEKAEAELARVKAAWAAEAEDDCQCTICTNQTEMYVCTICGNKRCPHATDCRNECTGSNEPGQEGSSY